MNKKTAKYNTGDTVRFWHFGYKYTGMIEDIKECEETVLYKIYSYEYVITENLITEKIES